MLEQTDRVALAVPNAKQAAAGLNAIFDSVIVDDAVDADAGARRITLQWGRNQLELYEPKEEGPVANFIDQGKRGLFAGGFASSNPAAVAARLEQAGVKVTQQGDRFVVYPHDLTGTGVIVSPIEDRERVGLSDRIWQITYTVSNLNQNVERYRALFGIEDHFTNYYDSALWGYHAAITWFDARKGAGLDSLEFLEPFEHEKAAGRFLARTHGVGGIYMASVHTDDLAIIRERINATGGGWDGPSEGNATGFIHPRRTFGLLLAVCNYDQFDVRRPTPENPDAWG